MSKRISKKKLAANRKNAQKSTGPKTEEGKTRAARNAIKHGLLAQTVVVHAAHESQTDFDQLLEDLRQDLQPAGPLQETLTERIATCYWRLRRAQRYESGCIEQNFANLFDPASNTTSPPDYLTDIANLPEEDDLKNLIRYESMIDRQLHRSLHELRQQQKQKQRRLADLSTLHSSPQVQLPQRIAEAVPGTDYLQPKSAEGGVGTADPVSCLLSPDSFCEAPLRQTNPNPIKNNNNPMTTQDLQQSEKATSNTPIDETHNQTVYQYPNNQQSTGAATEKRRKIQTA